MSAGGQRWLLVLLVSAMATAVAALAPRALQRMSSFHVQQVEVAGARYLSAQEAVAATGISPTSSVFDDFTGWRTSLLRQPLVLDAEVTRRLPFTVVFKVTETRPLAFAMAPELRPVDARGRLLDIDPTRTSLDLPLLVARTGRTASGRLTDAGALRALATLGRIAELEPALFAAASEVAPLPEGVSIVLRAGAQLLVPDAPDAEQLHLLRLTLVDVTAEQSDTGAGGRRPRLRRIDARYREQIVVAFTPNESR